MDNPRKDYIYRKLDELKKAIEMDSFNLTRGEQDSLQIRLEDFKTFLNKAYENKPCC